LMICLMATAASNAWAQDKTSTASSIGAQDPGSQEITHQLEDNFLNSAFNTPLPAASSYAESLCGTVVRSQEEKQICESAVTGEKGSDNWDLRGSLESILCKAKCYLTFQETLKKLIEPYNEKVTECCSSSGGTLHPHRRPPEYLEHLCVGPDDVGRRFNACMNNVPVRMTVVQYNWARAQAREALRQCLRNCEGAGARP
jgi:hypothetical protein